MVRPPLARGAIALLTTSALDFSNFGLVEQSQPVTAWSCAAGEEWMRDEEVFNPLVLQNGEQVPPRQPGQVHLVKPGLAKMGRGIGPKNLGVKQANAANMTRKKCVRSSG